MRSTPYQRRAFFANVCGWTFISAFVVLGILYFEPYRSVHLSAVEEVSALRTLGVYDVRRVDLRKEVLHETELRIRRATGFSYLRRLDAHSVSFRIKDGKLEVRATLVGTPTDEAKRLSMAVVSCVIEALDFRRNSLASFGAVHAVACATPVVVHEVGDPESTQAARMTMAGIDQTDSARWPRVVIDTAMSNILEDIPVFLVEGSWAFVFSTMFEWIVAGDHFQASFIVWQMPFAMVAGVLLIVLFLGGVISVLWKFRPRKRRRGLA